MVAEAPGLVNYQSQEPPQENQIL